MSIRYICTYCSNFKEPYYSSGARSQLCTHKNVETWETTSRDTVYCWLSDTLDIPLQELTLEQVHKDFDDSRFDPLPEDRARSIMEYYNGRLALYNVIVKVLKNVIDNVATKEIKEYSSTTIKHNIPEKHNTFWVYGEKDGTHQLEAYISIEVKEEPDEEKQA